MTDILDLIDQATAPVCGWCQTLLAADGVSAYFCDDECQFEWQRVRQQGAHVGAGLDLGEFTSAPATVGGVFRRFNDGIAPVVRQFQDAGGLPVELPTDPRERALTLRRNRNTGPQQRVRAPRTIRPRGCS